MQLRSVCKSAQLRVWHCDFRPTHSGALQKFSKKNLTTSSFQRRLHNAALLSFYTAPLYHSLVGLGLGIFIDYEYIFIVNEYTQINKWMVQWSRAWSRSDRSGGEGNNRLLSSSKVPLQMCGCTKLPLQFWLTLYHCTNLGLHLNFTMWRWPKFSTRSTHSIYTQGRQMVTAGASYQEHSW